MWTAASLRHGNSWKPALPNTNSNNWKIPDWATSTPL